MSDRKAFGRASAAPIVCLIVSRFIAKTTPLSLFTLTSYVMRRNGAKSERGEKKEESGSVQPPHSITRKQFRAAEFLALSLRQKSIITFVKLKKKYSFEAVGG
ncbi:hypothetical protein EVAR_57625_1 [Eumeta japonica]|uniref:Uncharacterized protein n=1 Tax=Eumeta variegata TaxID=151549 RepID=A0A4C1ZM87_EUMVA|nr:hypothetical protein EVAR_57625_1 [Eumeta japonica]